MLSRMMSWKQTSVWVVFGVWLAGREVTSSQSPYSNSSDPTSVSIDASVSTDSSRGPANATNPGAARTTNFGAAASSTLPVANTCDSVNFTTYLAPSLQDLPSASLELYFASGYQKLNSDLANIERYADSPVTDTAALLSYLYAELSTISADIDSLYGPSGHGILSFQNIATTDPCLFSACLTSYLAESSAYASLLSPGVFDYVYTASPPCCGQCTIVATGVQLAYWPTPAPTPPVSILVNENNISYISPSVYVFFTSLNAHNLCGPVGNTYPLLLRSYGPTVLSTSSLPTSFVGIGPALAEWTSIDYADFGSPKCICTTGCQYDSIQHEYLTDICTPQLSIPPGVSLIDPLWASCATNLFGVFDPPIALTIQPGLMAPKNAPAQPTSTGGGNPLPLPPTSALPVNSPTPTAPIMPPTVQSTTINVLPTVNPEPSNVPPQVIRPTTGGGPSSAPVEGNSAPAPAPSPVVNGQTITPDSQSNFVVGTQILTINPQGNIVIGTQTLTAGGSAVTISGTTILLAQGGTAPPNRVTTTIPPSLIVNGQTITENSQGNFVVGIQILTTNSQGNIVIGTQTLIAGGSAATISEITLSLGVGATEIVYGGSSTIQLGSITQSFMALGQNTSDAGNGAQTGVLRAVCITAVLSALMVWI